jgi:hypothetical protein
MTKKVQKRGTPRRASKAQKPAPSKALVKRAAPRPSKALVLPENYPLPEAGVQALGTLPMMSPAFIGTLKLTGDQIAALRRPVESHEIEWKPLERGGPPAIPYLGHNGYRDRLDAAFGLGGWGMVPVGMPQEKDGVVYVPYALVVDGVPRIYAWGEQAYHANNKQMTYGDALEGCKSNAILRCGKELGIAREMWNKAHLATLKAGIDGGNRGGGKQERQRAAAPDAPVYRNTSTELISIPQRRRLWALTQNAGRTEQEVAAWLGRRYGYTSESPTKEITRDKYDEICKAIESPDDLPAGGN